MMHFNNPNNEYRTWNSECRSLRMALSKTSSFKILHFSGDAAAYNILEQNVILDPRFLRDDDRFTAAFSHQQ